MKKFTALTVLRLGLGINMLMHGAVRIPKLNTFAEKTAAEFDKTVLPHSLVMALLFALPFMEALTGLLVLIGGKVGRIGYILGSLVIAALLFGTTLREEWATAGSQLIYILAFAFALYLYDKGNANSLR